MTSRSDKEGEARAFLGGLLTPFTVAALVTVDVQVTDAFTLFVLHDVEDDVHIAAQYREGRAWTAHVVVDDGGWTISSPPIESLAHLHELLPEVEPGAEYPAWQTQIAVKVGERYAYAGSTYEVVQAHTTQSGWEPPNVPALWVRVVV
ncbi:MAG TPA: carbohydrate-binding protein [Rariglobus sp.]